MNILIIDTSQSERVRIGLQVGNKTFYATSRARILKSQAVLPLIDKILKGHKLNMDDIEKIQVNTGPGSFTGLKVGTAIANALSFSLLKSVNNKEIGEVEIPQY